MARATGTAGGSSREPARVAARTSVGRTGAPVLLRNKARNIIKGRRLRRAYNFYVNPWYNLLTGKCARCKLNRAAFTVIFQYASNRVLSALRRVLIKFVKLVDFFYHYILYNISLLQI